MKKVRTRFAPSPTGYMHIGNLRTALYEYLVAKKEKDGVFILRIEDTDQGRLIEGATDVIMDTIKKCGLIHDEGPDIGGDFGPYIQSERMKSGIYKEYALKLCQLGGAHPCFCDQEKINEERQEAESKGLSFKYVDPCKSLSKDEVEKRMETEKYVIRQSIPEDGTTSFIDEVYGTITVDNSSLDDAILLKSDGFPTYNFANIIDDHFMDITHVVRGNEYLASTPKYNLIYEAFGWDVPTYIHCPPVMKDETHKLSKRNGDASFQDLVKKGFLPEAIINYIALLGWAPETEQEIYTLDELKKAFSVHRINKNGAIFDIEKLRWVNAQHLRKMEIDPYLNLINPFIDQVLRHDYDRIEIAKILQPRVIVLNDVIEMLDFINQMPEEYDIEFYRHKRMKTNPENSLVNLIHCRKVLDLIDKSDWTIANIENKLMELVSELGCKNGQVLFPLRLAITGYKSTPGGAFELSYIFGKTETLRRLDISISLLQSKINVDK